MEHRGHNSLHYSVPNINKHLHGYGNQYRRLYGHSDADGYGQHTAKRLDQWGQYHLLWYIYDVDGIPCDRGDVFVEQRFDNWFDQRYAERDDDLHGDGNERERLY